MKLISSSLAKFDTGKLTLAKRELPVSLLENSRRLTLSRAIPEIFIVNPLPGSELYDFCKKREYIVEDHMTMDFKTANIRIPKGSPDYGMDSEELVKLIDEKTREFNEWARREFPERWNRKFELYLKSHPEDAKIIMGRVT